MAPHIGEPERKYIWLSLWHATVEILGDPTVGGGNANSNLQPYTSNLHATASPRKKNKYTHIYKYLWGPMVIVSSGLPKKRRKFCPSCQNFSIFSKHSFF